MEFRVLGPLEVIAGGVSVDLGGRKQRTVLALLVANAAHQVSTDRLIEGTYGEEAGAGARRSVQTYVSSLRKRLGDVIVSSGHAYELRLAGSTVDSIEFGNRVEAARGIIGDDCVRAARELHEALDMWRGHPFEDVDARGELDLHISQLSELRLVALESRVDADLACGHNRALVGELEALAAEYPFRETFHAQLMMALYRSGRQAEALRAFQRMRQYLAEELGIEASPELQHLEQRILEHDPGLLLDVGRTTEMPAVAGTSRLQVPGAPAMDDRVLEEESDPPGKVIYLPTNGIGPEAAGGDDADVEGAKPPPDGPGPPSRRPAAARLALFAGAIVVAGVLGAIVSSSLTDDGPRPTTALPVLETTTTNPPEMTTTIPPEITTTIVLETTTAPPQPEPVAVPELVGTMFVGQGPQAALADESAIWFTLTDDAKVVRIDLATIDEEDLDNAARNEGLVGASPTRPLRHDDELWVPCRADGVISVVDKDTLALIKTVEVGRRPDTPLDATGLIWVTARRDFKLVAINPETHEKPFGDIDLPGYPLTPVFVQGGIWVVGRDTGVLARVDANSGQITGEGLELGGRPWPPILVNGEIWIADRVSGVISIVDPLMRRVVNTINLDGAISPPLFVEGRVWVSDLDKKAVAVIDVEKHRVIKRVPTNLETTLPAEHNGAFWAADPSARRIVRIDPVELTSSEPIPIDGSLGVPISAGDYLWVPDTAGSRVTLLTG